jgi:hypothetical protein
MTQLPRLLILLSRDVNGTLVKCHTTALGGKPFVMEIKEEWAPHGAKRLLELVQSGYFTGLWVLWEGRELQYLMST